MSTFPIFWEMTWHKNVPEFGEMSQANHRLADFERPEPRRPASSIGWGLIRRCSVYLMMDLEGELRLEQSTDDFYDHRTVEAVALPRPTGERRRARRPEAFREMDSARSLVALLARRAGQGGQSS